MDIAISWNVGGFRGEWTVANGDLATTPGLDSAVLVSLFTWRRASADYVPPAGSSPDRHGWWADTYSELQIGSRLWQLKRAVKYDATLLLLRAQDICLEALQWLVDDGVAATVQVRVAWLAPTMLGIVVLVVRPDGTLDQFRYGWAWV